MFPQSGRLRTKTRLFSKLRIGSQKQKLERETGLEGMSVKAQEAAKAEPPTRKGKKRKRRVRCAPASLNLLRTGVCSLARVYVLSLSSSHIREPVCPLASGFGLAGTCWSSALWRHPADPTRL
jgi:hypothetical protein